MRILHLPVEIAGQVNLTAAMQRQIGEEAWSLAPRHPFGYPVDFEISSNRLLGYCDRFVNFLRLAESFDVFHYHFGSTLLPGQLDALYAKVRGRRVVTEFWGSDVRLPQIESQRNPYYVNTYEESQKSNQRKLERWSRLTEGEVIFSDQSFNAFLKPYFDCIHIVGQRVNIDVVEPSYPSRETKIVRVVHAPSQQMAKGTVHVEDAIESLRKKGLPLEYVKVNRMSHQEAMNIYRTADLVVDQLCSGSHGVFACEAMALGKPVVCYILPEFLSEFPAGFPIINANPGTIETVLEEWVLSPGRLHERGRSSRAYVERVHNAREIAADLVRIYARDFERPASGVLDWRKIRHQEAPLDSC